MLQVGQKCQWETDGGVVTDKQGPKPKEKNFNTNELIFTTEFPNDAGINYTCYKEFRDEAWI